MVVYVPSKRRIKLPDIPGIINAVTAMKPEKNKYKRFISTNSLDGKRYRKLQIQIERVNPIKNRTDILGFRGSKKAEQSKKQILNNLKILISQFSYFVASGGWKPSFSTSNSDSTQNFRPGVFF